MTTEAEVKRILEASRKYMLREGYCFLCGEKCLESSTGVLHRECAIAYDDIKEKVVERIFQESKIWAG